MEYKIIKTRKLWIDLSKVILIYLMVACHIGMPQSTDTIIVSFHMSAFFFISGYLHQNGEWWSSILKSIKRLLIPVLFFNLLGYCVWLLNNTEMTFSFNEYIIKPILGIVMLDPSVARPMCMPMWFCIVLFFAKVFSLISKRKKIQIIILICCLIVSILFFYFKFSGSNFMGRIFLGSFFYLTGFLQKENIDKFLSSSIYIRIIVAIISFVILYHVALYNGRVTWLNYEFGKSFLLFVCTSIFGTLVTFTFSSLVYKKSISIITYFSNNTLTVLGIHLLLFPLIPKINSLISTFIIIALCLPIICFFNKFVPALIGNNGNSNDICNIQSK